MTASIQTKDRNKSAGTRAKTARVTATKLKVDSCGTHLLITAHDKDNPPENGFRVLPSARDIRRTLTLTLKPQELVQLFNDALTAGVISLSVQSRPHP